MPKRSVGASPSMNSRITVVTTYISHETTVVRIAILPSTIFRIDGGVCMIAMGAVFRSAPHCRRGARADELLLIGSYSGHGADLVRRPRSP